MDTPFIKYITDTQLYDDVLARVASVKHTLWIGTADIKDVYVKAGAKAMPLLAVLDLLVKRGIAIRILHAKEPGPAFRDDFDKFPSIVAGLGNDPMPTHSFQTNDIRYGYSLHRLS